MTFPNTTILQTGYLPYTGVDKFARLVICYDKKRKVHSHKIAIQIRSNDAVSPKAFRLDDAERLLYYSCKSASVITAELSCDDYPYFSSLFKKAWDNFVGCPKPSGSVINLVTTSADTDTSVVPRCLIFASVKKI